MTLLSLLRRLALFVLPLLACSSAHALTPEAVLKELEQITQQKELEFRSRMDSIMREVGTAAAADDEARDLLEKVTFQNDFYGKKEDEKQFVAWKQSQRDNFRDKTFRAALRLHLQHLHLALRLLNGESPDRLTDAALSYYRGVEENAAAFDEAKKTLTPLLYEPLNKGAFARYYRIGQQLEKLTPFNLIPREAWATIETGFLPRLRETRSPQLLTFWDDRLNFEKGRAFADRSADKRTQFETRTLPSLTWSRAQDAYLLGDKENALRTMMQIVRENQLHPSFDNWVKALRALVKPEPSADAAPTASAPAPAG